MTKSEKCTLSEDEIKRVIYNFSVSRYDEGLPIKSIVKALRKICKGRGYEYSNDEMTGYVYRSIYDDLIKKKKQQGS